MIPEPQLTYVLELLKALGSEADDFVVVGAQAMKFALQQARATKDIDFILDVVKLRSSEPSIAVRLKELGYAVVEGARNFQFQKTIPDSKEPMRIEFMAPEEFKREKDFRVDVEEGIHARACAGGSIALAESTFQKLSGRLPDGAVFTAAVRVTKAHALVMLKLLALDDRYRNVRGSKETQHDREEARTHAADIVAIVTAQRDLAQFKAEFERQLLADPGLGIRVLNILHTYFRETTSPGLLVYEESLVADKALDRSAREQVTREIDRAHRTMREVSPPKTFYDLASAVEDSCNVDGMPVLAEEFLGNLEQARIKITDQMALEHLPSTAFGGAIGRGERFTVSASAALKEITAVELQLLYALLETCAGKPQIRRALAERFPHAMG